jgi:hypothetical protein
MCLNCGCGQPDEDHGNTVNITARDLQAAADANGQSLRESAQHILEGVELVASSGRDADALAKPAGPAGAGSAPRGTAASES